MNIEIGQKFGRWLVLNDTGKRTSDNRKKFLCECQCSLKTRREVSSRSLIDRTSQSCGCLRKEKCSKAVRVDLQNKNFGLLIALSPGPNKNNGRTTWNCICQCGNLCIIGTKELQNGDTQSCGCLRDSLITTDMTGYKIGKLTVIGRNKEYHPYGGAFWDCDCECGGKITVLGGRLRSNTTPSCGCIVSKGESEISNILRTNGIKFSTQFTFKACVTENNYPCRFDFAVFKNDFLHYLIEYDGIQHFEETNWNLEQNQLRDKIKNDYCQSNNIPLIRIPYLKLGFITLEDLLPERSEFLCIAAT